MGGASRCIICGTNAADRSYFKFPNAPDVRKEWFKACNLNEYQYLCSYRVCDAHFQECNFTTQKKEGNRKRLKKNVVPTQFFGPSSSENSPTENSTTSIEHQKKSHESCVICHTYRREYSYHRFPKSNPECKKKWLDACNLSDKLYSDRWRICGIHFEKNSFHPSNKGSSGRLKNNAIPILYLPKKNAMEDPDRGCKRHYENTIDIDCRAEKYRKISTNESCSSQDKSTEEMCVTSSIPSCSTENVLHIDVPLRGTPESTLTPETMDGILDTIEGFSRISETSDVMGTKMTSDENESTRNFSDSGIASTPTSSTPTRPRIRDGFLVRGKIFGSANVTPQKKDSRLWRYADDIHSPHVRTPNSARKALKILKETIVKQKKINRNLRRKLNRAVHRIQTLKGVLNGLKKKNLLSDHVTQHIMVSSEFSPESHELLNYESCASSAQPRIKASV